MAVVTAEQSKVLVFTAAHALQGVPAADILKEVSSYDTVGCATSPARVQ